MRFLTEGYHRDPLEILNNAVFEESYDEMVLVKDIEFYSLCEHHLLPFFGRIHVAYIPNGRIVGLSKLPRMVGMFARRLQVQERLTTDVAGAIETVLRPKGVAVVAESIHLCMMMRGVRAAERLRDHLVAARRIRGRSEDARGVHAVDPAPEAAVRLSLTQRFQRDPRGAAPLHPRPSRERKNSRSTSCQIREFPF